MKKSWMIGIVCMMFSMLIVMGDPAKAEAAGRSDREAYEAVFDASFYYNAYPDVAAACGTDANALLNHYISFGVYEGRNASAEFNAQAYRQRYQDLEEAFGDDMAAYCRHYVTFGAAEGRNAAADGEIVLATNVTIGKGTAKTAETASKGTAAPAQQEAQTASANTVIGTCTTSYQDNIPRAVNVELAAQRVNGTVVQPGGSFSFSNTILARTSANGYVEAPIFISGKKGTGIGGGVCQVSSTLYAAMVYAGLPATERHAHSLPVDYLPEGLDATIAGNYMDLRFTNTFSQPLLIQASAEGGTLTVTLVLQ